VIAIPDRPPVAQDFGAAAETVSTSARIARLADQEPMSTAVVDGALRVTYRDLVGDLARCAHWLEQAGLAQDVLAAVETFRNRYIHLLLLLGCEILGVPTTPLIAGTMVDADPVLSQCRLLLRSEHGAQLAIDRTVVIPDDLLDRLRAMPVACCIPPVGLLIRVQVRSSQRG
jgi:acyl-CoA synthetase (AMP-forming)/AMP-acid ligase II